MLILAYFNSDKRPKFSDLDLFLSNRNGIGAKVMVTAGGMVQQDQVRSGSSYLSSSDRRLHFGLGKATRVDSIVIRWPSGKVDQVKNEAADQELAIQEGKGIVSRRSPPHPAARKH